MRNECSVPGCRRESTHEERFTGYGPDEPHVCVGEVVVLMCSEHWLVDGQKMAGTA